MSAHLSNNDPQKRERETIFRLFAFMDLPHLIKTHYSIYSRFYIVGKNLPYHYFLNKKHDIGDIDVCLIPYKSSLNHETITISPNLEKIFGIEVKTMAYGLNNKIKSPKFKFEKNSKQDLIQAKARKQANKLIQNGFDDVSLLYLLTTEPSISENGNISDWFLAGERALQASDFCNKYLYFDKSDKFSTLGIFIGSLYPKIEIYSNTSTHIEYFIAEQNSNTNRENSFRKAFENKINSLFPIEVPLVRFPVQIRACSNQECRNIYLLFQGDNFLCPICNFEPY